MKYKAHMVKWRRDAGLTQEEAAKAIGTNRLMLVYYESGKIIPDRKALLRLCELYRIQPEEMVRCIVCSL